MGMLQVVAFVGHGLCSRSIAAMLHPSYIVIGHHCLHIFPNDIAACTYSMFSMHFVLDCLFICFLCEKLGGVTQSYVDDFSNLEQLLRRCDTVALG